MLTDPETQKLQAALEQLESEQRRRIDERIAKGEAVRAPFGSIVVGVPGAVDAAIAAYKARDTREVYFDEGAILITGVPRAGRDDGYEIPTSGPSHPCAPCVPKTEEHSAAPPSGPVVRSESVRSAGESVSEPRYVRAQIRRPDPEKNDPRRN